MDNKPLLTTLKMLASTLFFSLIFCQCCFSQTALKDNDFNQAMTTDRPDFTEATQTVQKGHVQFELGYTFSKDKTNEVKLEEHIVPEILMRLGLNEDLEFRFVWGGYISNDINSDNVDGYTDISLGFKHRMYQQDSWMPDLSLIGEIFLPVGSGDFTSDEAVPGLKFLWGYDLGAYSLAGNLNFASPIGQNERYFEIAKSISLATSLSDSLGLYLEYYGIFPVDNVIETTEHYVNGGFTYMLGEDVQLDIRAGHGINEAAGDFFAGSGISFRL